MLQAIRDGSKGPVAKVIVGLIILTFALFGIESIVALGGGEDAPATVNGEEISEFQVLQAVQMQKRRFQAQLGENFDPSIFKDELLRESSVESLINETIVKQAAEDAGVQFSNAQIDALILQSPEFQVNGKFDAAQFDLVLRSAGFTRQTYRELLRTSLLTQQLQNAWQTTSFATPLEAESIAKLEAQTRDFSFSTLSLEEMKKDVVVSDEEIEQYYQENTHEFMIPEKVSIKYVELNAEKLGSSIEITEADIKDSYDQLVAESNSKKEYRAAHILLLEANEAAQQTMAEIQAALDQGKDFESLAKEYSEDDTSKFSGGDLGFADDSVYEDEFATALIGLEKGQVSAPVETRDGLHLIKLLDVRQPEVAPFSDLKDSLASDLRSEAVQVIYLETLERLKDEAFSSSNLDSVAASLELEIKTEGPFARSGGEGIASNRNVIESAFSELVMDEGANSEVIELNDTKAVVIHLDQYLESKPKELADVRSEINTKLIAKKATEALTAAAESYLAEPQSFVGKWASFEDKTRQFTGAPQEVVAKAFEMGISDSGSSYSLVDLKNGDKALIELKGINREIAAETNESQKQKVSRVKSTTEFRSYFEYQREEADIEKS